MNILDHLTKWQQTFEARLNQSGIFLLLAFGFFVSVSFSLSQFTLTTPATLVFKQYKKEHQNIRLFDSLLVAISDGILQAKLYI